MTAPGTSLAAWDLPRRSCGAPADTQSDAGIRLITVMEPEHLRFIAAMAPESRGKSLLFGQWLEPQDIPDPYRKSREAFEYVFGLLGKASREWARRLGQKGIKH